MPFLAEIPARDLPAETLDITGTQSGSRAGGLAEVHASRAAQMEAMEATRKWRPYWLRAKG